MRSIIILIICFIVSTYKSEAQICFELDTTLITQQHPNGIISADFNRDGRADIATANTGANSISVFLANNKGGFDSAHVISVGYFPLSIITSDFNNDNNPDIVVSTTPGVAVLLGNGNGTFASQLNYLTGNKPYAITNADLNTDGNMDMAVLGGCCRDSLYIMYGNSLGGFNLQTSYKIDTSLNCITSGDFNNDGMPDLVIGDYYQYSYNGQITVLLNNGGSFNSTNYAAITAPLSIVTTDINEDGNIDILTCNGYNAVVVNLGVGNGSFLAPTSDTNIIGYHWALISDDFNGDGLSDIATTTSPLVIPHTISYTYSVSVQVGNRTSKGSTASNYSLTGINADALVSADFNNDGKPDLAVANTNSNNVSVLLNCTSFPPQKKSDDQVIIPNIFTPNGDSINDTFFVKGANLTNFSCKIYDRWGGLLYQWTDINTGWNGKDKNGAASADGTYFYVITYTDNTGKTNNKNGFLQLLR